jgi:hypothetical protein
MMFFNNTKGWFYHMENTKENAKKKKKILFAIFGSATVAIASLLIFASPSNPNSQSSNSGSSQLTTSTSSQAGSTSLPVFSGSEVPNWDLTRPALSADSSAFNVGLDRSFFTRFQGDYYYATGINFIPDAPNTTNPVFGDINLRILNVKTGQMVFSYAFNPGEAYHTYLKTTTDLNNFGFTNTPIAYDGNNFVYFALTVRLQIASDNINSRIAGDYTPVVNALQTKYPTIFDQQNPDIYTSALLRFDLNNPTSYTVLDVSQIDSIFPDILIEDNVLYAFHRGIFAHLNALNPLYSFVTLPNVDAAYSVERATYLLAFTINANGSLTQINANVLAANNKITHISVGFRGFREGFVTRFRDASGRFSIGTNFFLATTAPNNKATINTTIEQIALSFVSPESFADAIAYLKQETENRIDEIIEINPAYESQINPGLSIAGLFDTATGLIEDELYGVFPQVYNQQEQSNIVSLLNESRLLLTGNFNLIFIVRYMFINTQTTVINQPFNYAIEIYQENKLTNERTLVLDFNDEDGIQVTGIFQRDGGYYLTGTAFPSTANPNILESAALIALLDNEFNTTETLLLDGSGVDRGGQISLNNAGQPVWFVTSNSTDGPFAAFAASNPNNALRTYTVTFN